MVGSSDDEAALRRLIADARALNAVGFNIPGAMVRRLADALESRLTPAPGPPGPPGPPRVAGAARLVRRKSRHARQRAILLDYLSGMAGYEVAERYGIIGRGKAVREVTDAFRWFAYAADRDAELEEAASKAGVDLDVAVNFPLMKSWYRRRRDRKPRRKSRPRSIPRRKAAELGDGAG
jgi:hypothetical protein